MQVSQGLRHYITRTIHSKQFSRLLFLMLAGFFLFECYVMSKNIWVGDLWTHTPPIIEFAKNGLNFENPWIRSSLPDVYMTPFHWFWGKIMMVTGIHALPLMTVSGALNLILIYLSTQWFCRIVLKQESFLFHCLLLFALLFYWGYNPWDYSGFFHFRFINFVLPYPSTLGFCLLLIGVTLSELWLNGHTSGRSLLMLAGYNVFTLSFLFLIHPLTFIFYNTAIAAFFLSRFYQKKFSDRQFIISYVLPVGIAGGLVVIYPFYPVLDFFKSGGDNFHFANWNMYDDKPLLRLLPALFSIFVVLALPTKRYTFIKIFFGLLWALYILGYVTGKYSYGRSISLIYFCAQVSVALYIKDWYRDYVVAGLKLDLKNRLLFAGVIAMFFINLMAAPRTAYNLLTAPALDIAAFEDIKQKVDLKNDILISPDKALLQKLPTFVGKGIVPLQPSIWIKDEQERKAALDSFFQSKNSEVYGRILHEKYGVTHVMIPNKNSEHLGKFQNFPSYSNQQYTLYRIADPNGSSMSKNSLTVQ